jgi:hypothetical protein
MSRPAWWECGGSCHSHTQAATAVAAAAAAAAAAALTALTAVAAAARQMAQLAYERGQLTLGSCAGRLVELYKQAGR